jgi:hypothetical protein
MLTWTKEAEMAASPQTRPGDVIVVEGRHVGDPRKTGEILEVFGGVGRPHYRVRWDDDRETMFYPGADVMIRHRETRIEEPAAR